MGTIPDPSGGSSIARSNSNCKLCSSSGRIPDVRSLVSSGDGSSIGILPRRRNRNSFPCGMDKQQYTEAKINGC